MEDIKILKEGNLYTIILDDQTIKTKVTEQFLEDFKLLGILPEEGTEEEIQQALENYLIQGAKQYVEKGLNKPKTLRQELEQEDLEELENY